MQRATLQSLLPVASEALYDILDSEHGAVQLPIRSEIFGPQRFVQHGHSLAETHRAAIGSAGFAPFFPRIHGNIAALRRAHAYIGALAGSGYDISPAAEWLLDNFHLVEAQLKEIKEGLPRSYYRKLPLLQDEPLAGLPRIYGVAWAFVAHTDGAFDEALLVQFLMAYEDVRQLNLSEMWALPTTLRVVLVENLRRLAEGIATQKAAREVANLCADQIKVLTIEVLDSVLELLNQRGAGQTFLLQLALRFQDHHIAPMDGEQTAVQSWLQAALPDFAALRVRQGAEQAADNLSVSNAITSLRAIGDADWPDIIARTSTLMRLMLTQPVFAAEDISTRDRSLHAIERLARQSGLSEVVVAQRLLVLVARANGVTHPATHWLMGLGQPELLQALGLHPGRSRLWIWVSRHMTLPLYLGTLLTVVSLLLGMLWQHSPQPMGWSLLGLAVLVLFPASEAVVAVVNRLISESARPQHLPRLSLVSGIPAAHRVLVVIPSMLTGTASARELAHRLHLHYLANPEQEAQFALLTDWADADTEHTATDAAHLACAVAEIEALNASHRTSANGMADAPRFIVLHRARRYSDTEQRWIGWERKRGKLEVLIAALATGESGAFLDLGGSSRLAPGVAYVLTLDSDTQLPPGRLRELVGVAAHPHNQPQLDATGRSVVSGYGILQPRVAMPLPDQNEFTLYHWLFSGQCGIDPYSAASSEVYQDVFSEGTFTGKGLLHVQAVHAVLAGRLPEGQVLSHDLIEGSIARCAAVSDLSVIEDAPFHADVAASRVHRWTRGDWQLLPYMLQPKRYGLRAVHIWKMLDNLRRSLVAPMSLGLLVLALAGSAMSPWVALALVFVAFSAGPVMGALAGLSPSHYDIAKRHFYREALADLARALLSGLWLLAVLLPQSIASVDAITRALYRTLVSRRHLLQWTTAATAQAQAKSALVDVARLHWREPLLALVLLGALLWGPTRTPVLTTFLCLLWGAAPVWTWWVSRVCPPRQQDQLILDDRNYLEGVARDSWRLFERSVGPEDRHLPPDNLQVLPHDMLAHRTSPTNIGMYLLSAVCARQFGWIGVQDLLSRLEATLATLQGLERYQGHFMNWYDTQTGLPMLPMYVSTVDSGNLSAHLLAVGQACLEFASQSDDGTTCQRAVQTAVQRLMPLLKRRRHLRATERDELKWLLADHRATRRSARRDTLVRTEGTQTTQQRLQTLAQAFKTLAWEADFQFLYSSKRHLLHIGYRVAEHQLDSSFYDLLASEARLTSLLGIARGDLPVRHWAYLGRTFFACKTHVGLRSWTGSMFEYLMPGLVLNEPRGSVLSGACHTALLEQMAFAKAQGVPWGISESAYAGSDHTLAYQYAPQGVPRLALRRTPVDELVVAPYATALAAMLAPHLARQNYTHLERLGARLRYGFIEALDFTVARRQGTEAFVPVGTFMAHHQGMTIVALANVLLQGAPQRWGMANAHLQAVSILLHERIPREISELHAPPANLYRKTQRRRAIGLLRDLLPGCSAIEPTHVLSNGRYSVLLRANGAGSSRFEQTGITRTRDDALRDDRGSFFYLRRKYQTHLHSITQHPAPDPAAHYSSAFHADRVCFDAVWSDVQAQMTVWISPEDDIEFRQITLHNLGDQPLDIELLSAFEVALSDPRADEAHPAFTNLFVSAQWLASHQALLMARKPRLTTEQGLQLAHFITESNSPVTQVRLTTDRLRWLGRGRAASQPLGALEAAPDAVSSQAVSLDTGLDPVCALSVALQIASGAKAHITFATAVSKNPDTLRAVIDKYRQPSNVARASLMSATLTGIRLRALRISAENFSAMQTLTSALVMSLSRSHVRAVRPHSAATEVCDRQLLWRFDISGDRPIILVLISVVEGLGLIRALSQGLGQWLWGNLACDLVVVNAEPSSYLMVLDHEIAALRDRHAADASAQAGGAQTRLHLLRSGDLTHPELNTLHSLARVVLHADGRPLTHHVAEWLRPQEQALERRMETSHAVLPLRASVHARIQPSAGVFAQDSGEFSFTVSAQERPPRPWINVLANPAFGAHVSEAGGGYTWALNSRLNQLTAWSNDAVSDPPSEWFLLQDTRTREVWPLSPGVGLDPALVYRVVHGQGFTRIEHRRAALEVTATWCVDADTSVKQVQIALVNHGTKTLNLRLIGIAEWMMGANRSDRGTVRTGMARQGGLITLLATQRERSAGFGGGTAFFGMADAGAQEDDWTCDRRECFDARGRLVVPDFFGQTSGDGLDPCAALSTYLSLAPGRSDARSFLLGFAASADQLAPLCAQVSAVRPPERLVQVCGHWNQLLGATTVKTPDPLFDALVNRWLLYQAVTCRLWAKSGFYQAGGATGFRDQLQDAMALAWAAPAMLRQQIVLHASRQFVEGDVQHWWHAPTGVGVRTHFSDDRLWLVAACTHYLQATQDFSVLDEQVPFLEGPGIPAGAEDAYYGPTMSAQTASVYEHAARTIDRSLELGVHGLPLMGSGDWNDGMNRVGIEGRGESVWMGWFLCRLITDFAPLAHTRGDTVRARRWEQVATDLKHTLATTAWDGAWFKRAYFDDGQPLGSHSNIQGRIDLIAQAWAVLSDAAPPELARQCMASVQNHLVDSDAGLIKLLDPPLTDAVPSAGYIQAYPPGVRENGGQYSHAGVWALIAQAQTQKHPGGGGDGDAVYRYFTYLSPAHRASHPTRGPAYGLEPYVMAADVYSQPPYVGRGGWSWYTGAAAWMHRAAIGAIFGLTQEAKTLVFHPCLPNHWPQAELTLVRGERRLRFILMRATPETAQQAAAPLAAHLLLPGQVLNWQDLPEQTCFVIPL